ncbi:uncharacterized protein LOC123316969 isoform X1 [Coccinella septempunctata]|uniref:uncharacterized protein LOC123316969 isoform X1 n=1 Tax=Coccinella septempunctata TaxID=41139 RepID=UPI001D096B7C|nr:uncharacterized protein LOC123316969 isoform X1 [Coccinella septempunctata]
MPKRTEPKFKLPPIRPEKENLAGDISVGKCENTISIPKDNVRLNPELDFIVEQRKREELAEILQRKRYNAEFLRQRLQNQWLHLEHNEHTFQRTIISHNRFLKRNLEKRERALAKIQTDMELTKKRDREIKALDKSYDFFNAILNKMRLEIRKHSIYENYLNSVVENADSPYKSNLEFLTKYESLQHVKEHCVKRQTAEMATTVLLHDDNVEFFRLRDIVLIGLRNELNNLRCQFDDVCRRNLATETLITTIVNRTNELNAEVSSCQYMIDAIYRYICQRRRIPQGDYDLRDVKPKIDVLKSTLGVWAEILASSESKRKKSLRNLRKSHLWKSSLAQGLFMWKRKASMKLSAAPLSENEKKKPSLNKLG